jgi:hypothetical protein
VRGHQSVAECRCVGNADAKLGPVRLASSNLADEMELDQRIQFVLLLR